MAIVSIDDDDDDDDDDDLGTWSGLEKQRNVFPRAFRCKQQATGSYLCPHK